jgi:hypothetical protein
MGRNCNKEELEKGNAMPHARPEPESRADRIMKVVVGIGYPALLIIFIGLWSMNHATPPGF